MHIDIVMNSTAYHEDNLDEMTKAFNLALETSKYVDVSVYVVVFEQDIRVPVWYFYGGKHF